MPSEVKALAAYAFVTFWFVGLMLMAPSCNAKADVSSDLRELVSELRAIRRVLERATPCTR